MYAYYHEEACKDEVQFIWYLDLEIKENGNISLSDAHKVAEQVHDAIEKQYPVVKHIMVHVNPEDGSFSEKT